ncbi:protein UPSTREAM OF FLC [Senna tora]|uniref:Protein UPSTREAM OF FLC n=1 Tax=Senna tora TaxID=362788 RepID=A0A834WXF0_9FABA|nr:protein UPSTREAM OF FLC [Senna tora]
MEVRSRRARHPCPSDRAKICSNLQQQQQQKVISLKKVQVVYYLSRNGLLEHPHSMEVSLLPNEPLRLKHVLDRLIALRGSGMPSLYSWSCKRSYKSGYVWYDLGVNDVIHPADGAEFVLKGSEVLLQSCSERFQQLGLSNRSTTDLNSKRKAFQGSEEYQEYEEELDEEVVEEYEDGEKTSYTSSTTTPHSRCSRGVSTDELEETKPDQIQLQPHATVTAPRVSSNSKRSDEETETGSRNSVLLQLIACGSSAVTKARSTACVSNVVKKKEKESGNLQRVAVRKSAEKVCEREAEMINYISENPRFGNSQSEEKEYFSGSIVESMKAHWDSAQAQPVLKKSNSYNEQRSGNKVGDEVEEEEGEGEGGGMRGKCMPRKRCSGSTKEIRK